VASPDMLVRCGMRVPQLLQLCTACRVVQTSGTRDESVVK